MPKAGRKQVIDEAAAFAYARTMRAERDAMTLGSGALSAECMKGFE